MSEKDGWRLCKGQKYGFIMFPFNKVFTSMVPFSWGIICHKSMPWNVALLASYCLGDKIAHQIKSARLINALDCLKCDFDHVACKYHVIKGFSILCACQWVPKMVIMFVNIYAFVNGMKYIAPYAVVKYIHWFPRWFNQVMFCWQEAMKFC